MNTEGWRAGEIHLATMLTVVKDDLTEIKTSVKDTNEKVDAQGNRLTAVETGKVSVLQLISAIGISIPILIVVIGLVLS